MTQAAILLKENEEKAKKISVKVEYSFYALFLLYASISLTYRSWEPSFIVQTKIADKTTAALAISSYSILMTFFRFIFMYVKLEPDRVLRWTSFALIVVFLVSILGFDSFNFFLLYFVPGLLGIIFASYIPFLYSLPKRYGKQLSSKSTANTIIAYAIGEVFVCAAIGFLMEITPMMLFYSLLVLAILNLILMESTIRELRDNFKEKISEFEEKTQLSFQGESSK